jgi:hypothetical protein
MTNPDWNQTANSAHSFGRKGRVVTPSDNDLKPVAKTIIMLSAGDITIVPVGNANENPLEFIGLPAGYIVPYVVRRVTECTGTCATCD